MLEKGDFPKKTNRRRALCTVPVLVAALCLQFSSAEVRAEVSCPCDLRKITKPAFAVCRSAFAQDDLGANFVGYLNAEGLVQLQCRDISNKASREATLFAEHDARGNYTCDWAIERGQKILISIEVARLTEAEYQACVQIVEDDAAALGCEPNVGDCLEP